MYEYDCQVPPQMLINTKASFTAFVEAMLFSWLTDMNQHGAQTIVSWTEWTALKTLFTAFGNDNRKFDVTDWKKKCSSNILF